MISFRPSICGAKDAEKSGQLDVREDRLDLADGYESVIPFGSISLHSCFSWTQKLVGYFCRALLWPLAPCTYQPHFQLASAIQGSCTRG